MNQINYDNSRIFSYENTFNAFFANNTKCTDTKIMSSTHKIEEDHVNVSKIKKANDEVADAYLPKKKLMHS